VERWRVAYEIAGFGVQFSPAYLGAELADEHRRDIAGFEGVLWAILVPVPEPVQPVVKFKKLRDHATIPAYQTPGAAGMDLHACFEQGVEGVHLMDDMVLAIPTGLAIEVPPGYEAQIRPRSGLAAKEHITVLNTPGTIDSDYRGEVKVILINYGPKDRWFKNGDRIAQLVIAPVAQASVVEVEELTDTARGAGGFGSTGT